MEAGGASLYAGGAQAGPATAELTRAAATIEYFIFADLDVVRKSEEVEDTSWLRKRETVVSGTVKMKGRPKTINVVVVLDV